MIDAHITDGAQVVVRVQPDTETGDIAPSYLSNPAMKVGLPG